MKRSAMHRDVEAFLGSVFMNKNSESDSIKPRMYLRKLLVFKKSKITTYQDLLTQCGVHLTLELKRKTCSVLKYQDETL